VDYLKVYSELTTLKAFMPRALLIYALVCPLAFLGICWPPDEFQHVCHDPHGLYGANIPWLKSHHFLMALTWNAAFDRVLLPDCIAGDSAPCQPWHRHRHQDSVARGWVHHVPSVAAAHPDICRHHRHG
jgi:hypothetical protein